MGLYALLGFDIDMITVISSFLFGKTIVPFGWYLQACTLFYLFFFFTFSSQVKRVYKVIFFSILLLIYCVYCYIKGIPTTWYECSFCMLAGMIVGMQHNKIINISLDRRMILIFMLICVFVISFILGTRSLIQSNLKIIFKMWSSVAFALSVYTFCHFFRLKGKVWDWLGTHYLEIYIFQGVSMLAAERYMGNVDPKIYWLFCFCSTLLLASVMKRPIDQLMKGVCKMAK